MRLVKYIEFHSIVFGRLKLNWINILTCGTMKKECMEQVCVKYKNVFNQNKNRIDFTMQ